MWFPLMLSGNDADRVVTEAGDGKVEISDNERALRTDDFRSQDQAARDRKRYADPGTPDIQEVFSDWQDTGGIKMPHKIVINQGGQHYADITITAIAINQGLTAEQIAKKP